MPAAKIAITLPCEQLARARRAVRNGKAESVSAYIRKALEQQDQEESLAVLLRTLVQAHGEPTREGKAWARSGLERRKRG